MKKTLIALSTALTVGSAMAASSTELSTSTSSTLLDLNTYKRILKDVSVGYYGNISNATLSKINDKDNSQTKQYNQFAATYKINDDVNAYGQLRFAFGSDAKDKEGKDIGYRKFMNPRIGVRAFKYTNGDYSMSPDVRVELPMVENKDSLYAKVRLSQSSVYKINKSLSVGLWTAITENISSDKTKWKSQNGLAVNIAPSVAYEINDAHSFTVIWDTNTTLDKDNAYRYFSNIDNLNVSDVYNNKKANNAVYIDYINGQIKDLTIQPGLIINTAKASTSELGAQLQISASL